MAGPAAKTDREPSAWWSMLDPRASVRARLTLLVTAAAALCALATLWLVSRQVRHELARQRAETFGVLATQVSDKLDRALFDRYRLLWAAANSPLLQGSTAGRDEQRRMLEVLQEAAPELVWIGLADAEGVVTVGTQRTFESTSLATRPWFRLALAQATLNGPTEAPDLARRFLDPRDEGTPRFLSFALPMSSARGEPMGVIVAHLRWNGWAQELLSTVMPEPVRREQIGATVYAAANDALVDSGVSGWTHPPDAPAVDGARGVLVEDTTGGTRYFSAFARSRGFKEFRGLSWLTVVRQPYARAFAVVAEVQRAAVAWSLFFVTIAAVVTWLLATRQVRRLRSLRASSDRIREGDVLAVMPTPRGDDEIDQLCGSLGDLVNDFRRQVPAPPPATGEAELHRPDYDRPEGKDPRRVLW